MIDLRNTCVLVRTPEENQKLLKEAEKQGFQWASGYRCKPLQGQHFPDILRFHEDKDVTYGAYIDVSCTFYEASELFGTKKMTAREFIERITDIGNCYEHECSECTLSYTNTKCKESLCVVRYWKNNIDEILEIAASGRATVLSPEDKAIKNIEKLIQIPYHEITDEIKESLKLAVEKIKEGEVDGEINT